MHMPAPTSCADFMVRVAARFLKDPAISADAKALGAVLGAYADGSTGCAYVLPRTLEEVLGWGRDARRRSANWCGADSRLGWKRLPGAGHAAFIFCAGDRCGISPQRRNCATYH